MEQTTICHVCGIPYLIAQGHDCPRLPARLGCTRHAVPVTRKEAA